MVQTVAGLNQCSASWQLQNLFVNPTTEVLMSDLNIILLVNIKTYARFTFL